MFDGGRGAHQHHDGGYSARTGEHGNAQWDDAGQVKWLEGAGGTLIRGHARLAGARRVDVQLAGGQVRELEARLAVVLATGSSAAIPPIDGLSDISVWDSRRATSARHVPERFVVLGGGVVGVEMAQAWSALGSQVTLVHRGSRLIEREEEFASTQVADGLREAGVEIRLGVSAAGVARNGQVEISLDDGSTLEADEVLAAFGRRHTTDDVGLETVGLEPGGPLEVDGSLRVPGFDWLYAIGDVNGRALLTHMGKYQGRLAADAILGHEVAIRSDGGRSPRVIFTDPQVGAVGHTLASALEAGLSVRTPVAPSSAAAPRGPRDS